MTPAMVRWVPVTDRYVHYLLAILDERGGAIAITSI